MGRTRVGGMNHRLFMLCQSNAQVFHATEQGLRLAALYSTASLRDCTVPINTDIRSLCPILCFSHCSLVDQVTVCLSRALLTNLRAYTVGTQAGRRVFLLEASPPLLAIVLYDRHVVSNKVCRDDLLGSHHCTWKFAQLLKTGKIS